MTREEKFLELGKLYAEIHRLTNRAMELMDEQSADKQFEKAIVEHSARTPRKIKSARKQRVKKQRNYKCRDCGAEFESTLKKLDITCNNCGSPHIN